MTSRLKFFSEKLILILFLSTSLLLQTKNVAASDNNIPDMELLFSARAQGTDPMFGKEIPWDVLRQFDLLCQSNHCYLNVTTLNTETCDGKTKPTGWGVDGVEKITYSNENNDENHLEVRAAGSHTIFIKFKDGLIGDGSNNSTENSLIVTYEDDDPTSDALKSTITNQLKTGKISKEAAREYIDNLNKNRTNEKKADKLSGKAVGISVDYTKHGDEDVRSAEYKLLTDPVFCTIAFWPKLR